MEPELCQISLMVNINWADGETANLHSPNVARNDWTDEQIVAFLKSEMEGHITILQAKLAQRAKRIKELPPPLSPMEKAIGGMLDEIQQSYDPSVPPKVPPAYAKKKKG